jgi:transcriptional regulator with XRE-family HTH domain/tetratricopeptide (TPR) repeat protein
VEHESEVHLERSLTQNSAPGVGNHVEPAWKTVVELRSRRGWTQERLAEKAVLSVRTIQNLERGKSIHLGTIAKVAEALGVTPNECIVLNPSAAGHQANASPNSIAGIPPCPYRGLLAFREHDAEDFFGREALIAILEQKLAQKNLVQVSGCSGSGKSSLIAAGLIPALRRSGSWEILYFRPGADPFGALASLLIPYLEPDTAYISRAAHLPQLREVLAQGQLSYLLTQVLRVARKDGLLLIADQFEELYTLCAAQSQRDRFLETLASLSSTTSNIKVVYTIRADFTSRLLSHRRFIDETQDSEVKIGPMNHEELNSVIRKPAWRHNIGFEDGLAERVLNDAGAEPGVLPLLEFALTELWGRQVDQMLTHSAYERIGQLAGAIAHRAEKVYRSFASLQQEAAHHILTRLVRLAEEGGEDTRHRIPLSALFSEDLLNSDAGRKVLAVLAESRLVTVGVDSGGRQELVEIAHEALVRRWPRLTQWLQDDREILLWRQRLRLILREWEQTGRDEGFLLRGPLLDEARLWLSRRASDLSPEEKDFISCSLSLWHRERLRRPIGRLELLVDNPGIGERLDGSGETESGQQKRAQSDLAFLAKPGTLRLQINVIPLSEGQRQALRSRLPQLPFGTVAHLFSTASPSNMSDDDGSEPHEFAKTVHSLDDQTFALFRDLQMRGSSGLALELLNPQFDGISDPNVRLKFASIVFDMMHVRGRYADAAELIRQELALHPQNADEHSPLLIPLKIRLVHHQMFYRPVDELWAQMTDLLACSDCAQDPDSHGEILFMLGGNLGTLRGHYGEARRFLVHALRHAKRRRDHYLLTRCLRKYADFLRYEGHLHLSKAALMEALRLSARGRGTRQRIYVLGCLGDLERQQQNYSAASEYFERAIELARSTFIPGWLGNLHLGLAHLAMDRGAFDEARTFVGQAEAFYQSTHPRHWWGSIQVELGKTRLMRVANELGWMDRARAVRNDALLAGYAKEAAAAASLIKDDMSHRHVLMFL